MEPSPQLLTTARDVGGWVFATFVLFFGAAFILRWLMGLLDKQATAIQRLADALTGLTEEVRASMRRR